MISSVYTKIIDTGEKAKADRETKWRQINETKAINTEVTKIYMEIIQVNTVNSR